MENRKFNSLMPKYNEIWAAKILGMKVNSANGPDLIDDEKAVEIKFRLLYQDKYSYKGWTALGHQLNYNKDFPEIYWGFGFYKMDKEVNNISEEDIKEKRILERELYIVEWDWINQFPLYHQSGKTKISEWDHYLIYPKFNMLPRLIEGYEVEGGKLFFTEGTKPERFQITKSL